MENAINFCVPYDCEGKNVYQKEVYVFMKKTQNQAVIRIPEIQGEDLFYILCITCPSYRLNTKYPVCIHMNDIQLEDGKGKLFRDKEYLDILHLPYEKNRDRKWFELSPTINWFRGIGQIHETQVNEKTKCKSFI